ncbi:2-succinyl-5-enolpyruvyl-6-hydroxy-3-cyclohexene-1-carboxylic-acid synthase [Sporosarcina sp. Marseille-Q4063]|uniref:2-succinyl-5-enolpyruvyl-6-hydroxy-3- cyclohexene-1-carboxylic-acid synthase n=1 Tax=Sporosarcina sp. Marseille-Q4063 TaxID=2810514 RepID=UPI001BAFEFE6|nr:2-succinyl-5-enolpyruvyl-6-hydroxy-3-cyclohexene-1-carboxylic-acid synthase [Sporosarcina sp. Marseille-Q4063]QUW23218.1 2-succinyl-5-enolpyruvyl-6-hydroxy-3-cyclohexene-1-carboxylic-acid synthase [Sporosarcina sp. Marseille-Q4063]
MGNKKPLTNYVRRMTRALMNAGVKSVVISPGSRSTPLAYAFASTKSLEAYMQVDERSAGFFALGLAKATGEPVVLLCTSGTAASNYFPAVTEAHYARIPLIVITADRPHELREVGAPQAIDQIQLYGNHVKYSVDFPLAEENSDVDDYIERHVQRAASVALSAPSGPIHLNVPFREPLLIDFEMETPSPTFIQRMKGIDFLDASTTQFIESVLHKTEKGLLVVGELPIGIDTELFWKFAKALNWPVLCDPLSNLRAKVPTNCMNLCIDRYDALLKSELYKGKAIPDTVIRFGPQPVSKPLSLFLKKVRPQTVVLVDESPEFRDPLGIVTHHIQSSAEAFLQINVQKEESFYARIWSRANHEATVVMENSIGSDEGAYTQMLFSHLPDESDLISGSSMPIRDVDTFFGKTDRDITIFANRGTNGIDGVVSTALGIQAARKRPTWLLIGDLSFLHDVNGLIVSRFHETDLTIVIMNNDGGGIFSYLPQAESGNHFERLFGTPTGLTFEHIAAMYDAQYASIESMEEFEQELAKEKEKNIRIIEVFTNREANVTAHRTLWNEITKRIDSIE